MTPACMLVALIWSAGMPTQIRLPQDVYPACGECETAAEQWAMTPTPDQVAGVKTVRYAARCIPAPAAATVAAEPAPVQEPESPKQAKRGWW